jgi:RNA polymerase sigma-70 factor (ECF subfamily)
VNESEFEAFYCASAPRLRRYLARLCDDAEELVQETFFRFLRAEYSATGEDARKILFTIATNLARNRWSRMRAHEPLNELGSIEGAGSIERLDLVAALRKLSPRERSLLWLAYAEGYDHAAIAKMHGLSGASVRVLLFRAKRKLARLLEKSR